MSDLIKDACYFLCDFLPNSYSDMDFLCFFAKAQNKAQ